MRSIDKVRDGYAYIVALLVLVAVAGACLATSWLFQVTPTGLLPENERARQLFFAP